MNNTSAIALLSFIILLLLPLIFLAQSTHIHIASLSLIPITLILFYSISHLAVIAASRAQQIVTTTFWVFVYIFLGLAPLLQIATGAFPWPGQYNDLLLAKAGLIVITGLLAFDIGRHLIPARSHFFFPKLLQRPINKAIIPYLATIALAITPYILRRAGGLEMLIAPRSTRNQFLMQELRLPEMMLLTHGLNTPVYVLLVASLAIWISKRKRLLDTGWRWKLMTIALLVITLILNNPISTARFKVGTILLSLFFLLPWRRWSSSVTVGGLIFALILVFPFADLFRSTLDSTISQRVSENPIAREVAENGDYDAFQMIVNSAVTLESTNLQLGRQLSGALLFWVPRSMWSNKPISTGQWVAEHYGYEYTNLSAPLWAELFVDGGWLLLIVGFIGYGYLVRVMDQWHATNRNAGTVQVVSVLVPIYAGYQIFLLRGALMPSIAYLTPMVLVAIFSSARITRRLKWSPQSSTDRPKNLPHPSPRHYEPEYPDDSKD